MVQPKQSLPCSVPSHRLSFGVHGMPYSEPGFATIVEMPRQEQQQRRQRHKQPVASQQQWQQQQQQQPCVHGVLHKITRQEWAYVKATEGVGSKSIGYQVRTSSLYHRHPTQVSSHLVLHSMRGALGETGLGVFTSGAARFAGFGQFPDCDNPLLAGGSSGLPFA
jgi:hypothetical protein